MRDARVRRAAGEQVDDAALAHRPHRRLGGLGLAHRLDHHVRPAAVAGRAPQPRGQVLARRGDHRLRRPERARRLQAAGVAAHRDHAARRAAARGRTSIRPIGPAPITATVCPGATPHSSTPRTTQASGSTMRRLAEADAGPQRQQVRRSTTRAGMRANSA